MLVPKPRHVFAVATCSGRMGTVHTSARGVPQVLKSGEAALNSGEAAVPTNLHNLGMMNEQRNTAEKHRA